MEYTVMSMKYYIVYELYTDVYRVLRHAIVIMLYLYTTQNYYICLWSIIQCLYLPINTLLLSIKQKGFF